MRITLIGPTYPFRGGISHYTTLLYQALAERHEVQCISFRRQYPAWLYPGRSDQDPSETTTVTRVEARPLIDSLNPLSWLQAAWAIRQQQPDVLLLQWTVSFWGPLLLTLLLLLRWGLPRTRRLLLCHNARPHERGGWLGYQLQRAVARRCHGILCHSQEDAATMRQMVGEIPVTVVMLPTYAPLATQSPPSSPAVARVALGFEDAEPLLLFFGFVRPYKGVDLLFQAMPEVLAAYPEARLVVAGEWWADALPAREWLEKLGLHKSVQLLDEYIPNERLPLLFQAADVVVLPYRSATQSAVVQLAYGFGVPVITTRVGGLPEGVEHEGSGLLVPPDDPAALAAAIVRYQREGWRERLRPGVAAARERFSWAALVEEIEQAACG